MPDASAQPMSLADIARQARAKKQSESKSVKVLDDDNMPRGTYVPDASSASSAGASASGQASAYTGPLPEYRGKVVLLDFWATWCGPCRSALPGIKKLQSLYGGDQFVIVSISQDDDEDEWRSFVANHGMNWPQRFDADSSFKQRFGVNALPTYVLLGRDGSVLQRYEGESEAYSIVERVGPDLRNALGAQAKQATSR